MLFSSKAISHGADELTEQKVRYERGADVEGHKMDT